MKKNDNCIAIYSRKSKFTGKFRFTGINSDTVIIFLHMHPPRHFYILSLYKSTI